MTKHMLNRKISFELVAAEYNVRIDGNDLSGPCLRDEINRNEPRSNESPDGRSPVEIS